MNNVCKHLPYHNVNFFISFSVSFGFFRLPKILLLHFYFYISIFPIFIYPINEHFYIICKYFIYHVSLLLDHVDILFVVLKCFKFYFIQIQSLKIPLILKMKLLTINCRILIKSLSYFGTTVYSVLPTLHLHTGTNYKQDMYTSHSYCSVLSEYIYIWVNKSNFELNSYIPTILAVLVFHYFTWLALNIVIVLWDCSYLPIVRSFYLFINK